MVKITRAEVLDSVCTNYRPASLQVFCALNTFLPLHDFTDRYCTEQNINNRSADEEKDCTSVGLYGQREGTNLNYEEGFGLRWLTWLHEASAWQRWQQIRADCPASLAKKTFVLSWAYQFFFNLEVALPVWFVFLEFLYVVIRTPPSSNKIFIFLQNLFF